MGHKEVGSSQILSGGETKMNIQKRGFAYGAYVETEVTEGIMKRFRKTEDRELGHIQRHREDYVHRNLIMVTGEI